ncbi:hypothetical protein AX14_001546, partial [Amanita brunnescens Koide BX004]
DAQQPVRRLDRGCACNLLLVVWLATSSRRSPACWCPPGSALCHRLLPPDRLRASLALCSPTPSVPGPTAVFLTELKASVRSNHADLIFHSTLINYRLI